MIQGQGAPCSVYAYLAAKSNGSLLDLSGGSLRGLVGQEGDETKELSQQSSHKQYRREPLLLILHEEEVGSLRMHSEFKDCYFV